MKGARVSPGVPGLPTPVEDRRAARPSESNTESLKWETALGLKYAELGEIE